MKILQLIERLQKLAPLKQLSYPERSIANIEPLHSNLQNFELNTLYYGSTQVLSTLPQNANFLFQSNLASDLINIDNNNLIYVADHKFDIAVSIVKMALAEKKVIQDAKERLFDEVIKESSISSILYTAYGILGNPIALTDPTYRLLGFYPEKKINDPVWDSLYVRGFLEQDFVMMFETDKTKEKSLVSDRPIYLNWSWAQEIPRLSATVIDGKKIYGYLGIIEYNKPFSQADYEITHLVCKVLCSILKRKTTPASEPSILKQTFLANLLDGGISSEDTLQKTMARAKLPFKAPYCIFAAPLNFMKENTSLLTIAHNQLTLKIENIHLCTHGGYLVLLLFGKGIERSIKVTVDILKNLTIHFGVSNVYYELINSTIYYRQAIVANKIGRKIDRKKNYYKYENYVYQHLIESALKEESSLVFVYPGCKTLIEYDHKNKTNYAKTLHLYLTKYKNINDTSNELNIHRNTLTYRLKKCEEIAGFQLTNEMHCKHLQISLDILLYKEYL
ncbi:hypothetical protein BKP37_16760 [Anaerobacillus alkalilacustris]|uniref:PucR C-terminal helix-turn-helix domain-containing protein n=1 Tax=Anaerobacillus alkalilacustris TaxID=393763 RepID=A0A1S2LF95_9BACI|nr:helix-turn-helix domain-containing protein [Anaerobacillus alkalilacustris]OIJ11061.1 hypothetical protein BKP37_16760 [Anaerobacillus alkalilacustris]